MYSFIALDSQAGGVRCCDMARVSVAVVFVCFAVGAAVIIVGVALIICFVVRHKFVLHASSLLDLRPRTSLLLVDYNTSVSFSTLITYRPCTYSRPARFICYYPHESEDYGITGVRLSVCLFVCLSVTTITK